MNNKKSTDHISCSEYSFQEKSMEGSDLWLPLKKLININAAVTFQNFFKKNDLVSFLTINKVRELYDTKQYEIIFDLFEDMDPILEIEYKPSQDNSISIEQISGEIDALTASLQTMPLYSGSFEMILRKKNFELYKKGKYLLDEDKAA